jgi:hypothetical protein
VIKVNCYLSIQLSKMFCGHAAVALLAKTYVKSCRNIHLGTLYFTTMVIDYILSVMFIVGFEIPPTYYPYSHSVIGVVLGSVIAIIVHTITKKNVNFGEYIGLIGIVVSHYILDVFYHPRMYFIPFFLDDRIIGFGKINNLKCSFDKMQDFAFVCHCGVAIC